MAFVRSVFYFGIHDSVCSMLSNLDMTLLEICLLLLVCFGLYHDQVARTGRVALVRESGVDSKHLRGYSYPL